ERQGARLGIPPQGAARVGRRVPPLLRLAGDTVGELVPRSISHSCDIPGCGGFPAPRASLQAGLSSSPTVSKVGYFARPSKQVRNAVSTWPNACCRGTLHTSFSHAVSGSCLRVGSAADAS